MITAMPLLPFVDSNSTNVKGKPIAFTNFLGYLDTLR